MCFFVACRADPRLAQDVFRKMASLPHCAQGLSTEQGAAQVCCCRAAGATCSARLLLQHHSRQNAGSEKKCCESRRLARAAPRAGSLQPPRGLETAVWDPRQVLSTRRAARPRPRQPAASEVSCIRWEESCVACCLLLQLFSGRGLQLHAAGSSPPSPAPCRRNVHGRWEERGRGCFEIPAPVLFIWIPQCPWHSSHS